MRIRHRLRTAAATLTVVTATGVVFSAVVATAAAEDAKEVLETAMKRYEKRLETIENVTIVQEVMGTEVTTRLEKEVIDGHPMLVAVGAGNLNDSGAIFRHLGEMAEHATVKGTEEVDGHTCWVVRVSELGEVGFGAEASADFEPKHGTFFLDQKDSVMRRLVVDGTATRDGTATDVTMQMALKDYREVDGWLHPFLTEMSLGGEGVEETPEMAQMQEAMAEMKEQLEQMPPAQREMMEDMMKGRMAEFEKMAETGEMAVTVTVKEIRVNEPVER